MRILACCLLLVYPKYKSTLVFSLSTIQRRASVKSSISLISLVYNLSTGELIKIVLRVNKTTKNYHTLNINRINITVISTFYQSTQNITITFKTRQIRFFPYTRNIHLNSTIIILYSRFI